LLLNHLSGASTASFLLNHGRLAECKPSIATLNNLTNKIAQFFTVRLPLQMTTVRRQCRGEEKQEQTKGTNEVHIKQGV
jgi:hypothetical protein